MTGQDHHQKINLPGNRNLGSRQEHILLRHQKQKQTLIGPRNRLRLGINGDLMNNEDRGPQGVAADS